MPDMIGPLWAQPRHRQAQAIRIGVDALIAKMVVATRLPESEVIALIVEAAQRPFPPTD